MNAAGADASSWRRSAAARPPSMTVKPWAGCAGGAGLGLAGLAAAERR